MLSDEEKEIFNNLKEYMQSKIDNGYHKFIYNDLDWDFKCIDCINAIDNALKQSKEIEEIKKEAYNFGYRNGCNDTSKFNDKTFIRIDKIKEILGTEENDSEKILSLLQTIVDENARLEDIEDRKVQIEYSNVFNKGVKSVEDKIVAKIEDLKENSNGDNFNLTNVIMLFKSLLKKEQ